MASTINASTSSGLVNTADTSGILQLQTASTAALTIDASQNVGIGTASPAAKLDITNGGIKVSTGGYNLTMQGSTSAGTLNGLFIAGVPRVTDDTGTFENTYIGCGASVGNIIFQQGSSSTTSSNTERMRLDSSGSFMIGTTSPGGRLTVAGSDSSSSNNALYVKNSSSSALFYVRDDGWINLGNASVSPYNNTTGNGANMYIATDASVQRSTSSLKYKTDVVDARFGLADVLKLRAVNYKSKNPADGDKVFGGLIAEEVEEAGLTEFVIHAQDGTPDALNYSNMVSLAFKAIQEQQALITAQAETINALTARIVALEAK